MSSLSKLNILSHPIKARREDVVAMSFRLSQQRCRYVSNEISYNLLMERRQDDCGTPPQGHEWNVLATSQEYVITTSQMKHPATPRWYVAETSQWYILTMSYKNFLTTSQGQQIVHNHDFSKETPMTRRGYGSTMPLNYIATATCWYISATFTSYGAMTCNCQVFVRLSNHSLYYSSMLKLNTKFFVYQPEGKQAK